MDMNNVLLIMQAEQLGVKTCTVNFDYDKSKIINEPEEASKATNARRTTPKPESQDYLYKTLVSVTAGDMVAVEARGQIRLAQVVDVHNEVDLSYQGALSWVVANLTKALATVKTQRAAERAAINKLSRGKAMREAREYMADQKLGDFQLLDLIPHTPNADTEEALTESRSFGD